MHTHSEAADRRAPGSPDGAEGSTHTLSSHSPSLGLSRPIYPPAVSTAAAIRGRKGRVPTLQGRIPLVLEDHRVYS